MRLETIPVANITPNPDNPRGIDIPLQDPNLSYLKQSIRKFGVMVPIVVTKRGDRFVLIDGERRFRAAQSLGLPKLPAYVLEKDDGTSLESKGELLLRMFQIHHLRDQWQPVQQCRALESTYRRILKHSSVRKAKNDREKLRLIIRQLANKTGIDERTASDRIKFLRWPMDIKTRMYSDHEARGYSYVLEIEDKIIIPALENYPEYFDHVDPNDVRRDLFQKLDKALGAAQDVRKVAPYFRVAPSRKSDRERVEHVLDGLRRDPEMTYEEAQRELEKALPNVTRREPPSPRRLVSAMEELQEALEIFDTESILKAQKRAKASRKEIVKATTALKVALSSLLEQLQED